LKKKELEKNFIFEFEENEFFSNTTLTKTIYMKDEETPSHSEGTEINWKKDDLTKKIIKKKYHLGNKVKNLV